MHPSLRWLLALSLVATVAGCNKPANAIAAPAAADPTATASSSVDAAQPADTTGANYVLTMDKVDAYIATIGKVAAAAHDDPAMDDIAAMEGDESIDQFVARTEANPQAARILTSAGMSVREFAQTSEALMAGMMTAGALESGALKKIPDGIDPGYVDFVKQHKAEITAKMDALRKQQGA